MFTIQTAYSSVRSWNLKEKKPILDPDLINSFTASGDELSYIHQYFRGIPSVMMRNEVTWRGVYAQFLFENL